MAVTPRAISPDSATVSRRDAGATRIPEAQFDVAGPLDGEDDAASVQDLVQLLLFRLSEEWYSVPLNCVREVRQECFVSPIPCAPDFVLGVMSLRGEVLSVTDLGRLMRLGGLKDGYAKLPAVVLENEECATAVVVDELGEIIEIPIAEVEPPVCGIDRPQTAFLLGTIEVGGKMAGLLDTDRLLEPVGEKPRGQRIS